MSTECVPLQRYSRPQTSMLNADEQATRSPGLSLSAGVQQQTVDARPNLAPGQIDGFARWSVPEVRWSDARCRGCAVGTERRTG